MNDTETTAAMPLGWVDAPDSDGFWYFRPGPNAYPQVELVKSGMGYVPRAVVRRSGAVSPTDGIEFKDGQWLPIPTTAELIAQAEALAMAKALFPGTDAADIDKGKALAAVRANIALRWTQDMRESLARWIMARSDDGKIAAEINELPDECYTPVPSSAYYDGRAHGYAEAMKLAKATIKEAKGE